MRQCFLLRERDRAETPQPQNRANLTSNRDWAEGEFAQLSTGKENTKTLALTNALTWDWSYLDRPATASAVLAERIGVEAVAEAGDGQDRWLCLKTQKVGAHW